MHSIFTAETANIFIVQFNISGRAPNNPLVNITKRIISRGLRSGRSWPVKSVRVFRAHYLGDVPLKYSLIPFKEKFSLVFSFAVLPTPMQPTNQDFIISVPECNRWVISESPNVVLSFSADVIYVRSGSRIHCTGEHHVMPDQYSFFIANVIEEIVFVLATTP